jgi:hypothetical protein
MALIQLTTEMTEQEERAAQNSNNLYHETAFVHALMDYMTPIGYMFEWSPVSGGPDLSTAQKVHDHYGFGTWALLGVGRAAVCIDTSDPDFDTAGKTYGEKTHTLTIDEMPKHTVTISGKGDEVVVSNGTYTTAIVASGSMTSSPVGGDQPHNNIQPSIVVYRWQRIA